jgi:hypothetical protein
MKSNPLANGREMFTLSPLKILILEDSPAQNYPKQLKIYLSHTKG